MSEKLRLSPSPEGFARDGRRPKAAAYGGSRTMPGGDPGIPESQSGNSIWARRDLLSLAAWGAILTCFAASGLAILRMLFPRVLFEPPTSFKAGYPTEYSVGE